MSPYPRSIELTRLPDGGMTVALLGTASPPADRVTFADRIDAYRALSPLLRDGWLNLPHGNC